MPGESDQGKHRTPLKYELDKHRIITATSTITIAITTTITGTVIVTVATTARSDTPKIIYYSIAQGL